MNSGMRVYMNEYGTPKNFTQGRGLPQYELNYSQTCPKQTIKGEVNIVLLGQVSS